MGTRYTIFYFEIIIHSMFYIAKLVENSKMIERILPLLHHFKYYYSFLSIFIYFYLQHNEKKNLWNYI